MIKKKTKCASSSLNRECDFLLSCFPNNFQELECLVFPLFLNFRSESRQKIETSLRLLRSFTL